MLQAIIREDGKYENLRLSNKLHDGYAEVTREGNNILLKGTVVEMYVQEKTVTEIIIELKSQIKEIDERRIRAMAEPSIKDEETGETWLEYYTKEIVSLRTRIRELGGGE